MPLMIGGKLIDGPKKKILVIPRDPDDIVFHFVAITDDEAFDALVPPPIPPRTFITKLQKTIDNVEDPTYKQRLIDRYAIRQDWFFLQSIAPSDIKWQKVKLEDPTTYSLWRQELKASGFSIHEVNTIWNTFMECNVLSDQMMEEARNRFLASQVPVPEQPQ